MYPSGLAVSELGNLELPLLFVHRLFGRNIQSREQFAVKCEDSWFDTFLLAKENHNFCDNTPLTAVFSDDFSYGNAQYLSREFDSHGEIVLLGVFMLGTIVHCNSYAVSLGHMSSYSASP